MFCKEMSFTDEIVSAFPERNPLPGVLRQALQLALLHKSVRTATKLGQG
jgi:hypothetical protein